MMNKTEFLAALRRELGFFRRMSLMTLFVIMMNISMTPEMTKRK